MRLLGVHDGRKLRKANSREEWAPNPWKEPLSELPLIGGLDVVANKVDVPGEREMRHRLWPETQRAATLFKAHPPAVQLYTDVWLDQTIRSLIVRSRSLEWNSVHCTCFAFSVFPILP